MSAEKKGRKIGRGNSKAWVAGGGPTRMSRRKARNHGCAKPALHLGRNGTRDRAHSGMAS